MKIFKSRHVSVVFWILLIFILAFILLPIAGEAQRPSSWVPAGTTVFYERDGTTITTYKDGVKVTSKPDGTNVIEYPDGARLTEYPTGGHTIFYGGSPLRAEEVLKREELRKEALAKMKALEMGGGSVFKGTVTNKVTGKPVEESTVTLINTEKPNEPPRHVKTTPQGTYEIPNLTPGTYTAIAKGKCHEKVVKNVVVGPGTNNVDFQAENKPLQVVIRHDMWNKEDSITGVGDEYLRNLKKFAAAKLYSEKGINPDDIDWDKTKIARRMYKTGDDFVDVDVYFKNNTQGASGPTSPCVDNIPTRTTETPSRTTTQTPRGFVETNIPREGKADAASGPNDPLYNSKGAWGQGYDDQWALKRIVFTPKEDKNSAWNLAGPADAPVIVAVIDTGIDMTHPELAGKLWRNDKEIPGNGIDDDKNGYKDDVHGWNFIDNNNDLTDLNGHGTVNAGIIAASINNGMGIAGINPNVRIMALKALDYDLKGGSIETGRAILYAVNNGAKVINISIGGREYSRFEEMAIDYAHEKGVVVVVAAGNEGVETKDAYPAGLKNVITVASTDSEDRRTNFSNWGRGISIAAPGVDVLSLRAKSTDMLLLSGPKDYKPGFAFVGKDNNYYRATGTSFSAPLVSGVVSLLLSHNPKLTGEQVKRMILNSADDIEMPGWDQYTGYGLLNARKALQAEPDYYTDVRINRIATAKRSGKVVIEVYGTAESSDFEAAWVEAGFGEKPGEWKKAGETIEKGVKEGLITEVKPEVFTKRGQWSLRLMVKTKRHGVKEAWGRININ